MVTKGLTRKFAEQALQAERVLDEQGVNGNAGRVIFILDAANKSGGATQKEIVNKMALPKDVVSKLVGLLAKEGLLTQEREGGETRESSVYVRPPQARSCCRKWRLRCNRLARRRQSLVGNTKATDPVAKPPQTSV